MDNHFFKTLEPLSAGSSLNCSDVIEGLRFNDQGLIPVIAQQHDTHEVLMMAWMNKASLEETLATSQMCYWSRSRQALWRKGESSGHRQTLRELRIDCDGDTLLCQVDQQGPACHTNRKHCFYLQVVDAKHVIVTDDPIDTP